MKKKIQKPFDAEAAKNGAKVETRDGKSVRIVCYDKKGTNYPIIALIDSCGLELSFAYTNRGQIMYDESHTNDLVIVEDVECPKFKVGDWVVTTQGGEHPQPWLITEITSDLYMFQDTQGLKTCTYHEPTDTYYRLWTLDDAKPGDVLCYGDGRPFMFKELHYDNPVAYFGIDYEDSILIGNGDIWTDKPVRPATKEQRDTLFKKMKEAGYKWDALSLTLSKIQKRWRDDKDKTIAGYFICTDSNITYSKDHCNTKENYNLFVTEKQAKSAIAMARISQIMANDKRFGGRITDEEWCAIHFKKFVIKKLIGRIVLDKASLAYNFLAFHTKEQAELFLKENEDLVKDYYMMD